MSKIQITNLQPIGVELFQGAESFLTELKATEAHQVQGGKGKSKKSGSRKSKSKSKSGKSGSSRSGRSGGYCYHLIPPCGCGGSLMP
jgi:uncharacterized membrane protein